MPGYKGITVAESQGKNAVEKQQKFLDPTYRYQGMKFVAKIGRPRKHGSAAERGRAFRLAHDLRKITVDVPIRFAEQLRRHARLLRQLAGREAISDASASALIVRPTRKRVSLTLSDTVFVDLEMTREGSIIENMARAELIALSWTIESRDRMELRWPTYDAVAVIRKGYAEEKSEWAWYVFSRVGDSLTFPVRGRDNSLRRAKLLAEAALLAFATGVYEGDPTVDSA